MVDLIVASQSFEDQFKTIIARPSISNYFVVKTRCSRLIN